MKNFIHKKIIVGVTGGIAAYKSIELIRLLRKNNNDVQVVMSASARKFVTPLTLQAVSNRLVRDDLFDLTAENGMSHIELARWADLILIAPASANFIAQLASGLAPDLLTTLCLATEAPIILAPAMNRLMWESLATQENINKLKARNIKIIGPAQGEQACGEVGFGRMEEPKDLLTQIIGQEKAILLGKKIIITAGPTREVLDPVRYFSNFSTGTMGYALATAASREGATVTLISGPVSLKQPPGVTTLNVVSAQEMNQAVQEHLSGTDIFIGAAAVADYRPENINFKKIKKSMDRLEVRLISNPDIISNVANAEDRPRLVVGFAAETNNIIEYAKNKLKAKNLDAIIANQVGFDKGFGEVETKVSIIFKNGGVIDINSMIKDKIATLIIENLVACSSASLIN